MREKTVEEKRTWLNIKSLNNLYLTDQFKKICRMQYFPWNDEKHSQQIGENKQKNTIIKTCMTKKTSIKSDDYNKHITFNDN